LQLAGATTPRGAGHCLHKVIKVGCHSRQPGVRVQVQQAVEKGVQQLAELGWEQPSGPTGEVVVSGPALTCQHKRHQQEQNTAEKGQRQRQTKQQQGITAVSAFCC